MPHARETGLQEAATPVAVDIHHFYNFLLWIVSLVTLFVLVLLIIVVVKFNRKSNPVPSKVSHNTMLEIAWTLVPILILVVIAIPSFRLLFKELELPPADLTIKATGYQWYWHYDYPEASFGFDSNLIAEKDLKAGQLRLLSVDNPLVVPVGETVRVQVTGADVIHSWAMPSFGVKIDAIPGRLNETWFRADKPGTYYGQCSELCGNGHAFMPIEVRVVSKEDYATWVAQAKQEFAANGTGKMQNVAGLVTTAAVQAQ
ncbi:MAG: cytochrome c oxidase subunit II [Parvibaculaceae bacterium]|nr:cytochrome c oxidase subunit II [Parvibaculaceae bacterium]